MPPNCLALCDTAIRDPAEVKTIGERLSIRNLMEATRVYAAKHKMAQEARNACTKIVVLAEWRIGQELIEAQKPGELARVEGGRRSKSLAADKPFPLIHADIGLTHWQVHECMQMVELGRIQDGPSFREACDFIRRKTVGDSPDFLPAPEQRSAAAIVGLGQADDTGDPRHMSEAYARQACPKHRSSLAAMASRARLTAPQPGTETA